MQERRFNQCPPPELELLECSFRCRESVHERPRAALLLARRALNHDLSQRRREHAGGGAFLGKLNDVVAAAVLRFKNSDLWRPVNESGAVREPEVFDFKRRERLEGPYDGVDRGWYWLLRGRACDV